MGDGSQNTFGITKQASRTEMNPIKDHYRIKKPCGNCPFLKKGAIDLVPGRLEGIAESLLGDDHSTFPCHKIVHSAQGGDWDEEGAYHPSGREAMCAGAAAYLMKVGRPSVGMRLAFITGDANPGDWEPIYEDIVELEFPS